MLKKVGLFILIVVSRLLCGEMLLVGAFAWVAFWSNAPILARFLYGTLVVAYFSFLLHQLTRAGRRYFAGR